MARYLLMLAFFVCFCSGVFGQGLSGAETVKGYTVAQKQLLVASTAKFINTITQNNLDRDSVVLIACQVTGLPFEIAYHDDYLPGAVGADQIRQAVWYLHKAGVHKTDLDSALRFIREAQGLGATAGNFKLRDECLLLLGEYWRQAGNEAESKKVLLQVATSQRNTETAARAWHQLGSLHAQTDSLDVICLNKSLAIYQQLQLKEKEIELLWEIAGYHLRVNKSLMKSDLVLILQKQQAIGFKHSLFAEYELSYLYRVQERLADALMHANNALENMKWSGMSAVEGTFFMRMGATYPPSGNYNEKLAWYTKGLEHRSKETHVFWFKCLLYAMDVFVTEQKPAACLSLIQEVTRDNPPLTPWEKAEVLSSTGYCYEKLNNPRLADQNYMSFLALVREHPELDPQGELTDEYLQMIDFYVSQSDFKAARLFFPLLKSSTIASIETVARKNHVLFRLDSIVGDYRSAMDHHILYKYYDDSAKSLQQRRFFDELTIKYGAAQKDKDIKLLQKEAQLQETTLRQEKYTRNWILGGVALLLIIVGLLFYNSRLKQRKNGQLEVQRVAIEGQNVTLRHLVAEKEWLVKEIHHRVKNNFQTVMGLLGTQTDYLTSDAAIDAITDSQRRIQSMSLIHQKLYQSNNLSVVNIRNYIHELLDFLGGSLNAGKRVRFNLDLEPVELDLTKCIPLGLILNEAITNAFKYAFRDGREGNISISFKSEADGRFLLEIKDDGVGFPADQPASMGMNLIRGLCEEIGGQLTISGGNGTRIAVSFAHEV
jgi:two-component sensor histidine kinase